MKKQCVSTILANPVRFKTFNDNSFVQWLFQIVARQYNCKFGALTLLTVNFYFPAMRFYNIVTQTQTQSGSLPAWFCGEKGLEDFFNDVSGDSGAVVFH
jgi:hypothetical protein